MSRRTTTAGSARSRSSTGGSYGMREITGSLLGERLARPHQSLLDAGCGTGGFLGWASARGSFDRTCGVDVSPEAVALAREAVPGAEISVAPVDDLPFDAHAFDLVAMNDVLQHVEEADVTASIAEVLRVLRPDGALLVRTNGGRTMRRERSDWRLYDERSLRAELERGGFRILRTTYANLVLSLWGALRGKSPKAPSESTCGIPGPARSTSNAIGRAVLGQEARYLRGPGRRLPYGHTLFATRRSAGESMTPAADTRLSADVQAYFDTTAASYDQAYRDRGPAGRVLRRRAAAVLGLLGSVPGEVLDAGMGAGFLCAELDRRGWVVSGVDIAPAMVEGARARLPHRRDSLVQGSIHSLPFENERFDAVVATGVLEYAVDDLEGAVRELGRVLEPGGVAVVSYPNHRAPTTVWRGRVVYPLVRAAKRLLRSGRPGPPRVTAVPFGRVEQALAAEGMTIEAVVRVGVRPAPARLAERIERGDSWLARALAVQLVLRARKER